MDSKIRSRNFYRAGRGFIIANRLSGRYLTPVCLHRFGNILGSLDVR